MTTSRRHFFGLMAVAPIAAKTAAVSAPEVPWPSSRDLGDRLSIMLPPSIKEALTRKYTPWRDGDEETAA